MVGRESIWKSKSHYQEFKKFTDVKYDCITQKTHFENQNCLTFWKIQLLNKKRDAKGLKVQTSLDSKFELLEFYATDEFFYLILKSRDDLILKWRSNEFIDWRNENGKLLFIL